MDPPPAHAAIWNWISSSCFLPQRHCGGWPVSGITPRPIRHSTCWHNGGVSTGFARCPSTGEPGKRCASQAKRTRSNSCRQVFTQCPAAQALGALERLVSTDRASAVVASVDWNALRAVYEARRARPLFAEMRSLSSDRKRNQVLPGNPTPRTRRSAFSCKALRPHAVAIF